MPRAQGELSPPLIRQVVEEFYRRVRQDEVLGPIFNEAIQDWGKHLDKITLFWLTATRLGRGYPGRDFTPAHLRHATIQAEQLPRWMSLFRSVCHDFCTPDTAEELIDIAERMAENLTISLRKRAAEHRG